jgi:serine/threonine protein kinase
LGDLGETKDVNNKSEMIEGTIRGTKKYLAPEILDEFNKNNDTAIYNYKIDIYAFGKTI